MREYSRNVELTLEEELQVDRLCVRFEDELAQRRQPSLEKYLIDAPQRLHDQLLRELLILEIDQHNALGRTPDRNAYVARFPDQKSIIDEVFHARVATIIPDSSSLAQSAPEESSGSETSVHGRFLPGTRLAGRYRIVALLGRGGMGEVYRADDLKLQQTVALKFLPEEISHDSTRLALFHNEVRLSREVSHPSVCRVYDIGDVDGHQFLSMEYIDGEDLRILLRRIGQLPKEKAIQIAQQICSGLAAAHDRGILHRDLKPANVMIDGRGHARITDFGLARLEQESEKGRLRVGTPAYMAPEQSRRGETSVRSDLYSLGLLLYELFTGRRPFETVGDPHRRQASELRPPSGFVADLDPAIDQIILKCLETEPDKRPASALSVAAALPGGDPLAAALAAGETPSPELVAAGGEKGALRRGIAASCLAALLAGLVAVVWLGGRASTLAEANLLAPELLVHKARSILEECGWLDPGQPPHDVAYGYDIDRGALTTEDPAYDQAVYFWYRQSPRPMLALRKFFFQTVTETDPPPLVPGMSGVRLDASGSLRELYVVPPRSTAQLAAISSDPGSNRDGTNWVEQLSRQMQVDLKPDSRSDDATEIPPFFATEAVSWKAVDDDPRSVVRQVEAAFLGGRPVFVRAVTPWNSSGIFDEAFLPIGPADWVGPIVWFSLTIGMLLLAWRNMRLGRGDRTGATRLAGLFLVFHVVRYILIASHVSGPSEFLLFQSAAGAALYEAASIWVGYLALEPYLRRLWPETMISWSRLLAGRIKDPIVGRDVLIGLVAGIACGLVWQLDVGVSRWMNLPAPRPVGTNPLLLFGPATVIGQIPAVLMFSLIQSVMIAYSLIIVRTVTGRLAVAVPVAIVFWTVYLWSTGNGAHDSISWFSNAVVFSTTLLMLVRFGLLASTFAIFGSCVIFAPLNFDLSVWYAELGLLYVGVIAVFGLLGFYTSLGGQSIFRDTLLGEQGRI